MAILVSLFIGGLTLAYVVLLVFAYLRRDNSRGHFKQLAITIVLAALTTLLHMLPDDILLGGKLSKGVFIWLTIVAFLTAYGHIVLREITLRISDHTIHRWWLGLGVGWFFALLIGVIVTDHTTLGQRGWAATLDIAGILALGGLALMATLISVSAIRIFQRAPMPEIANHTAFWLIDIAFILMGIFLTGSGTLWLMLPGINILFIGMVMALYVYTAYHIFDIRTGTALAIRTLLTTVISGFAIFTATYLARDIQSDNELVVLILLGLLATLTALLYAPIEQIVENITERLLQNLRPNFSAIIREYSQTIIQSTSLEEVAEKGTTTLNKLLNVQRSVLILINDTSKSADNMELLLMNDAIPNNRSNLSKSSPIYQTMAFQQSSFLQFDMEFIPSYEKTPPDEIAFFRSLGMSAYAPVTIEKSLIGIIAAGPKRDSSIYYEHDLELLRMMGAQIGNAIRNARLIDDLRHLNSSMRSLNQGLSNTKLELEKLDNVKTDFITIASHELRTPLAQVRGYNDILEALNEQGMLDRERTAEMTGNLRKATERMEQLISAMLDVSQLDVNAMDLRFVETSPETIIKLAIEPLTDAIQRRRVALIARGLRGLPKLQGDLQRLVQAFRNVIVNAIKFTPDEGQIEIQGVFQAARTPDELDQILFSIADTGVGIDAQHIELIFDKFYRGFDPSLHSTGSYKFMGAGPGLGLTIARGIVEGHGGKIWAESSGHNMETHPGATFFIRLPLIPPKVAWRIIPEQKSSSKEITALRPPTRQS